MSTGKLDDGQPDADLEGRGGRDDSGVRPTEESGVRPTAMRPTARRPESAPPLPKIPRPAMLPAVLRPARVPKPSGPAPPPEPITPTQRRVAALEASFDALREEMRHRVVEAVNALRAPRAREGASAVVPTDTEARLAVVEARLAALQNERDELASELRTVRVMGAGEALVRGRRWSELDRRLSSLEEGAETARLRMRIDRLAQQLTATEERSVTIERRVHELEQGPELARLRMRLDRIGRRLDALEADDLTELPGVGRRTAARLSGMGVRTFAQLAAWTKADIESAAVALGVAPARVSAWVADAATRASRAR